MTPKPLHIAIIPDGNRRWAAAQGLTSWSGHERAADTLETLLRWGKSHPRVSVMTFWGFSTENWKRDPTFIDQLMHIAEDQLRKKYPLFIELQIRCLHSGRKDRIRPSLANMLDKLVEDTRNFTDFTFNIAFDYGGKDEIVRAWKRAIEAHEPNEPDEAFIGKYLDHPELPDIDLVIRTGGVMRTSNFSLWQTTYAEWFFYETLFPDLTANDLEETLRAFDGRKRNFGA